MSMKNPKYFFGAILSALILFSGGEVAIAGPKLSPPPLATPAPTPLPAPLSSPTPLPTTYPPYYIDGVRTTLDTSGNGYWNGTWYVGGVATTLPASGNGLWNGTSYIGGYSAPGVSGSGTGPCGSIYYINWVATGLPWYTGIGYWNGVYYIRGVATTLPESGCGEWGGVYYFFGTASALPSNGTGYLSQWIYGNGGYGPGHPDIGYYIGGNLTTLSTNGSGAWNNIVYNSGVPDPNAGTVTNGWSGYGYYLNGKATTLSSNGTGNWTNTLYQEGVAVAYQIAGGYSYFYDMNGTFLGLINKSEPFSGTGTLYTTLYVASAVKWENGLPTNYTGNNGGTYIIGGKVTPLSAAGTGAYNNKYYVGGLVSTLPLSGNGYWNSAYYLGGTNTTLGADGTGEWNGGYYLSGGSTEPPQAAGGLVVTTGPGTVSLSWTRGGGGGWGNPFSNVVYLNGSAVMTLGGGDTSAVVTGLPENTEVVVTIGTTWQPGGNGGGKVSVMSAEGRGKTPGRPTAPTGLTVETP